MASPRPAWIERAPVWQRFKGRRRYRSIDQIVLHESVTTTAATAIRVLKRRKLSVHYTIAQDGTTLEHCPPARRCAHAAGHNRRSIGVEIINRYYPPPHGHSDQEIITARWAHRGRYLMPPAAQLRAAWRLIQFLVISEDLHLDWPGVTADGRFRWGRIKHAAFPGVLAHARFQHADGLVPEHFALLKSCGMDDARAYEQTRRLASSGQRITDLPVPLYCADWPADATPAEMDLAQ